MKGQKGQSMVEFALIVPLVLLLVLGMIYGGFAYADYLQYSNAVRDAARDIAVQETTERASIAAGLDKNSNAEVVRRYADPLTKLYKATFYVEPDPPGDINEARFVTVRVSFELNKAVSVLPERLADLRCTMPIEKELNTEDTQQQ